MWKFIALGGAICDGKPSIGGSCLLLHNDKFGIVIDAGFYPQSQKAFEQKENGTQPIQFKIIGNQQLPILPKLRRLSDADFVPESSENNLPNFSILKTLEEIMVIVTHGHGDHSGAVPRLKRMFPNAKIVMTRATYEISQWGWHDYLHIMWKKKQSPIYGRFDLQELGRDISLVETTGRISFKDCEITLFPAGHILGAVSVLVKTPETSIFFSSDICFQNQRTTKGAPLLDASITGNLDYLVTESTYGGIASVKSRQTIEKEFTEALKSCLNSGGKVLLPALAIGRSAELFSILDHCGLEEKWPVWIDGSACQLINIYISHGQLSPFVRENYIQYKSERNEIINSSNPCVVIAPAGMLAGGFAQTYLKAWARDEKNLIALSCYQDRFTPGYRLLRTLRGEKIELNRAPRDEHGLNRENIVTVNAEVKQFSLSSHAKGDELVDMVNRMNPRRGTFLVHGEEERMDAFCAALPNRLMVKTIANKAYDL